MKIQPVIIVSPIVWLLVTFWKPLLVFAMVLCVLVLLALPAVHQVALDEAARRAAAPTVDIPPVWQAALTHAAATQGARP